MTIAYENTSADAAAWYAYYLFQTPPGRRALKRRRLAWSVLHAAVVFLVTSWLTGAFWWPILWSALTGFIGYLLAPIREKSEAAQESKRMEKEGFFRLFLGEKQVALMPDGIHTAWKDGEIIRKWHSLARWSSTDTHIILHWSDSEDDFSLIPKRAFHGTEHCRRFLELLEGYREGTITPAAVAPVPVERPLAYQQEGVTTPTTSAGATGWWRDRNQVGDAPLLQSSPRRNS